MPIEFKGARFHEEATEFIWPLVPSDKDFASYSLDQPALELVQALSDHGWDVPGLTVTFQDHWNGFKWYRYVDQIESGTGPDRWQIKFGRWQSEREGKFVLPLTDHALMAIAGESGLQGGGVTSITWQGQQLRLHAKSDFCSLYLYRGDNLERDAEWFFREGYKRISFEAEKGCLFYQGRDEKLHPINPDGHPYQPRPSDPQTLNRSEIFKQAATVIQNAIHTVTNAPKPIQSVLLDDLAFEPAPIPPSTPAFYVVTDNAFYEDRTRYRLSAGIRHACNEDLYKKLQALREKYGPPQEWKGKIGYDRNAEDEYMTGIYGGGYLIEGDLNVPQAAFEASRCIYTREKIEPYLQEWQSRNPEFFLFKIDLKYANDVYVADAGVYDKWAEREKFNRNRSAAETQDIDIARTWIPLSEYKGQYAKPRYYLTRSLTDSEATLVCELKDFRPEILNSPISAPAGPSPAP